MENQHQKITGYRDFDEDTVRKINHIKNLEHGIAEQWHLYRAFHDVDQRELALAKTHFEEAFMHFVKAVAKPDSVW